MIQEIDMSFTEKELNKRIKNCIETPWSVIESYFKDQHLSQLVRHQLE